MIYDGMHFNDTHYHSKHVDFVKNPNTFLSSLGREKWLDGRHQWCPLIQWIRWIVSCELAKKLAHNCFVLKIRRYLEENKIGFIQIIVTFVIHQQQRPIPHLGTTTMLDTDINEPYYQVNVPIVLMWVPSLSCWLVTAIILSEISADSFLTMMEKYQLWTHISCRIHKAIRGTIMWRHALMCGA